MSLSTTGEWRALKVGLTEIMVRVKLSDKTIDAIRNKYLNCDRVNELAEPKAVLVTVEAPL